MRDRTEELALGRESARQARLLEGAEPYQDDDTPPPEATPFMEAFLWQVDDIRERLEVVADKAHEVPDCGKSSLRPSLSVTCRAGFELGRLEAELVASPAVDEALRRSIVRLAGEITASTGEIQAELSLMRSETAAQEAKEAAEDEGKAKSASLRVREVQCAALSQKLYDILAGHNGQQVSGRRDKGTQLKTPPTEVAHGERCRAKLRRQLEIAGKSLDEEKLDKALSSDVELAALTQGIVTENRAKKRTLRDIHSRHQDLLKLETSIRQLHSLFMDMSLLVESQGELVDSIEHNVDRTRDYVAEATWEVKTALRWRSRSRRAALGLGLLSGAVALLLVALLAALARQLG